LLSFLLLVAAIRVVTLSREGLSPLSNFTPLAAMALFGGAYFSSNLKAFGWPLLSLMLSDLLLSVTIFKSYNTGFLYSGWYWVYGAFVLMSLAGRWLLREVSFGRFLTATLVCVLIHWILTDFGVWLDGRTFEKTAAGYAACLEAAIPFEIRFLSGTLVYGTMMFGSFEWMKGKYPLLKTGTPVRS